MLRAKLPTASTTAGKKWYQVSSVIRHAAPPRMSAVMTTFHTTSSLTDDLYVEDDNLRTVRGTISAVQDKTERVDRCE